MATIEERVKSLEEDRDKMKKEIEQLSKKAKASEKLAKQIESTVKRLSKFEIELAELKQSMLTLAHSQDSMSKAVTETNSKINKKSNAIIFLLVVVIGLFFYIATKDATTAQDIAKVVTSAGLSVLK